MTNETNDLNHWVAELDEFGSTFEIVRMVTEINEAKAEIKRLFALIESTEEAIMGKVTRYWSSNEITEAKKKFDGPRPSWRLG